MSLDLTSLFGPLMLVLAGVTLLCALLLATLWWQTRASVALLLWSAALASSGSGLLSIALQPPGPAPIQEGLAGLLLLIGFALMAAAARVLQGSRPAWWLSILPMLAWIGLAQLPPLRDSLPLHIVLLGPLAAAYLVAGMRMLSRLPGPVRARLPLLWTLGAHAGFYLLRSTVLLLLLARLWPENRPGLATPFRGTPWAMLSAVEGLGFSIASGFLLASLVREMGERRIEAGARTDFLTGLLNRAGFAEAADAALAAARFSRTPCALLLLDLDHFKQVNDRFGHAMGDAALIRLGALCRETLRGRDLAGRLGGDEFAILLPATSETAAIAVSLRLGRVFGDGRDPGGPHVGISIGHAVSPRGTHSLAALLAAADRRLYDSKADRDARLLREADLS